MYVYVLIDLSCKILYFSHLIFKIIKLSGEDGRSRAEQLLHKLRQITLHITVNWTINLDGKTCHVQFK